MVWILKNGKDIIERFGTSHSISLDDAIKLCGFKELEKTHIDDPDYWYNGEELWYDDLSLELYGGEIVKDIKERLKGKYTEVEVYEPRGEVKRWHTDFVDYIEDYSDDDIVLDYELMDLEEYNNTILINTSCYAEDLNYDKNDVILCIMREPR